MRLNYVREAAVTELRRAVESSAARYKENQPWLDKFFEGRSFLAESKVDIAALPALKNPDEEGELFELENAMALHGSLKDLSPSQASDERLWVWLAHGPYWSYMRARWPAERAPNLRTYVLEHYFLGDARTLVRHGLARLWWFGHSTYQPEGDDPYALTRLLLNTTDARQSLLERKFWRNREVLRSLLTRVAHWKDNKLDFYAPRERFRRLCKAINTAGGTVLLDSLSEADVASIVDQLAANEQKTAAAATPKAATAA